MLGNAIKFTSQGSIQISLKIINQLDDTAVIQISLADTGIGMTPEQLEKVLELHPGRLLNHSKIRWNRTWVDYLPKAD